ncbi:Protein of unknown function [Bacillus mycoides]|nr:Protein of unknown function [Bacillus mycoides]
MIFFDIDGTLHKILAMI